MGHMMLFSKIIILCIVKTVTLTCTFCILLSNIIRNRGWADESSKPYRLFLS